jgi:PAS domain S-box-containing protein
MPETKPPDRTDAPPSSVSAESFIEHTPCGFLSFSDNGTILFVNGVLAHLLGHERENLIGSHVDTLLSVAGRIYYQTHFFPLLKLREQIDEIYLSLRSKEKTEVPMMVSASRYRDASGQYVNNCVLLSMRERRKFEDELIAARTQAESAARAKDEFLAIASHELRTPLTAILGWLHLLRESDYDKELVRESLEVIERNAQLQSQLVSDILDTSRVATGKLRITLQPHDLLVSLREALSVAKPSIDAKHIGVETEIETSYAMVSGDPGRLQQIFWNLFSNASKFTPKGGKISIKVRRVNSSVSVTVSDTGEGIPSDFLPYVFERFRQADQSKSRKHGGLGLGLAIVRDLVHLHGGTISARSDGLGQGATFEVRIPIISLDINSISSQSLPVEEEEIAIPFATSVPRFAAPPITVRLDGVRLLVVDDSKDALDVTARILEQYGASVTRANSVHHARSIMETYTPDVLISDIEMPGEDGLSLIRSIRSADGKLKDLPAIALTAWVSRVDSKTTLAAGFNEHLNKPAAPAELIGTIAKMLGRSS